MANIEAGYQLDDPEAGQTAARVAAEVLETMFFTEAEPAACEHAWLEDAPTARVRFEGSHRGEMLLGVSLEAADPIAASFLGLEPGELTAAQRRQVIQELANILCGAMLSRLWPESTLALATPEWATWEEWPGETVLHRCFTIPEGMVGISIRLESGGASECPASNERNEA
jgi:CheY-specific phosphatase CheX